MALAIPLLAGVSFGAYVARQLTLYQQELTDAPWDPADMTYTVYGKLDCIWTRRQLSYFKTIGFKHKFVDCDSEMCTGIESYPVTIDNLGGQTIGYFQVEDYEWTDPSFMTPPRPPSRPEDFRSY